MTLLSGLLFNPGGIDFRQSNTLLGEDVTAEQIAEFNRKSMNQFAQQQAGAVAQNSLKNAGSRLHNFGTGILASTTGIPGDIAQAEVDVTTGLFNQRMQSLDPTGRVRAMSGHTGLLPEFDVPFTSDDIVTRAGGDPAAAETLAGLIVGPDPTGLAKMKLAAGILGLTPRAIAEAKKLLSKFPSTTPGRLRNLTRKEGGASVNLQTGLEPVGSEEGGLLVGKFRNTDARNTVIEDRFVTANDIIEFTAKNRKDLDNPDNFLGTWLDRETGKTYLDVSKRFPEENVRKATKFGERSGQIAIFRASDFETLPVGSWHQFLESPAFRGRLEEMERVGSDYLKQHPTGEWWDMHGTLFEEIYGKQNLDVLAGFIAATAPQRNPQTNLRVATEYMRRFLIGEPIIQPHWRVPEGSLSTAQGKQIGFENSFKNNLTKASEGRLTDLQQNKVREEAMALMGDPNAVVLDRHWARLAEDPANGIFTNAREGIVAPGKDYELLKTQVVTGAERAGRSPRDYSADVWTGIRETLRTKAELFGRKFRKGSIQGASKGYADILNDLIAEKANTVGMSYKEFTTRLSAGDVELLSLVLAAPIGAWAAKESGVLDASHPRPAASPESG